MNDCEKCHSPKTFLKTDRFIKLNVSIGSLLAPGNQTD
jgi:hypothetical protein